VVEYKGATDGVGGADTGGADGGGGGGGALVSDGGGLGCVVNTCEYLGGCNRLEASDWE